MKPVATIATIVIVGLALTGVVAALLQLRLGLPAPVAIAAALACGAAIGVWQGLWISRLGIPAFPSRNCGMKVALKPKMMVTAPTRPQRSGYILPNIFGHQ